MADGSVWCWGYGELRGQLGDGERSTSPVPVRASGIDQAVAISEGGGDGTCAWAASGAAWCWGGVNLVGNRFTPVPLLIDPEQ